MALSRGRNPGLRPDAGGGIPAESERQPDAPVGDYPMHDPAVAGNEVTTTGSYPPGTPGYVEVIDARIEPLRGSSNTANGNDEGRYLFSQVRIKAAAGANPALPQIATLRGEGSFAGNNPTAKRCSSYLTLWRSSATTLSPETDLAATGRATDKYQSSSDDAERSAEPKRLTRCGLTATPGAN